MTAVAIIPARGGSKRIARKNLKLFNGQPMIVWSIRAALKSGLFDLVLVSTDDEEIALVAKEHGAQVPFMRPAHLADDFTGTAAVIVHALTTLQEQGQRFEYACCIYATAPLLQTRYLQEGLRLLEQRPDKSFAFSVCEFAFAVQRALVLSERGALQPMYPQYRETRSQDLPTAYQDAGQFYWGCSEAWLRGDVLFSEQSMPIILPRHLVQDIDNQEDWTRAEYLYAALQAGGELKP